MVRNKPPVTQPVGMYLLVVVAALLRPTSLCEGFHVPSRTRSARKIASEPRRFTYPCDPSFLASVLFPGLPPFQKKETETSKFLPEQWKLPILSILLSMAMAYPAHAAFDASIFTNKYGDPLHPMCKRQIVVSGDGKSFQYSGTAVGPKNDPVLRGCTIPEIQKYKLRKGSFDGVILDGGTKISAGDGIHEGVWEPAGSAAKTSNLGYENVDGIRWNDGNKWFVIERKKPSVAGDVLVFSYIGASGLAGIYGIYSAAQRNRQASE